VFTSFVNKFFFVKETKKKRKRKLEVVGGEGDEWRCENNQEVVLVVLESVKEKQGSRKRGKTRSGK